jgi:hypothetical protein
LFEKTIGRKFVPQTACYKTATFNQAVMDYSSFYTELGRLAYSIARADGIVQGVEVDRICDLIGQEIEANKSEDHNMREAVLGAAAEFNNLRVNNASAREAFNGFTGFVDANPNAFDSRMKHLSLRVALRIASAHDGVNETELALIEKLKKKLDSVIG